MKRLRWDSPVTNRDRPVPKHPYRDTAILYGVLAVLVVVIAWATGGSTVNAAVTAGRRLRRRHAVELALVAQSDPRGRSAKGKSPAMSATATLDAKVDALCGDPSRIRAPRGTDLNARSWSTEAPLRMLLNNLDPEVAERPEELVVYGGSGKAARNPEALRAIVRALLELGDDETLLVQSGKPVGVFRTHASAPRVLIANSLLVPRWATWDEFRRLEAEGLTMFGQMTAGSWIYIGTQGILQGTYQTFAAAGEKHFGSPDLDGTDDSHRRPRRHGRRAAARRHHGGRRRAVRRGRSVANRTARRTRYLDEAADSLDDALDRIRRAAAEGRPLSVGVLGERRGRRSRARRARRALRSRHRPDGGARSADRLRATGALGGGRARAARVRSGRVPQPCTRVDRARTSRACSSTSDAARMFSIMATTCRGEAREAGLAEAFSYPGFVPAYIRPLFCRGIGPFRWAALSGDPADIAVIDDELRQLFPDDALLQRWLQLAPERVAFQGLPARICWLGYGDRARAGLAINELVRSGRVSAPVVIGRDHLDAGSVASPYRETEAMRDGSDAIADWPILNALLNTAAGATWVSVHHGGGVGIGNSIHAGMVVVADGTDEMAERLERVLTTDPGTGVMRHVDAGYPEAIDAAAAGAARACPMLPPE